MLSFPMASVFVKSEETWAKDSGVGFPGKGKKEQAILYLFLVPLLRQGHLILMVIMIIMLTSID